MYKKVIQIAATPDQDGDPYIFALCDDGTVYRGFAYGDSADWVKLEPIPNDDGMLARVQRKPN